MTTSDRAVRAMIAPFDWVDFVSGLPKDLKRGKSLEGRLAEFRDGLAVNNRAILVAFFRQAAEPSKADWSLYSPELGSTFYFQLKGKTSQQFYAEALAIFEQGAT